MEGINLCIVRRKSSLKIVQERSGSEKERIESQGIDESNSLAESKSALLYNHTKRGEEGGEAVEVKVGREKKMELWSEFDTGGMTSQTGEKEGEAKTKSISEGAPEWE